MHTMSASNGSSQFKEVEEYLDNNPKLSIRTIHLLDEYFPSEMDILKKLLERYGRDPHDYKFVVANKDSSTHEQSLISDIESKYPSTGYTDYTMPIEEGLTFYVAENRLNVAIQEVDSRQIFLAYRFRDSED